MAEKITTVPAKTNPVSDSTQNTPAVSPDVARAQTLLNAYKEALSGRVVSSASAAVAARSLVNLTTLLIENPNNEVFTVIWNFHKDNQDGVCVETKALTGLRQLKPVDPNRVTQTIFLYNTFRCFGKKYIPLVSEQEFASQFPVASIYRLFTRAK